MSGLGVNQVPNHADFRLLSRTALTALKDFKEQNLYLRGLIPLLGYKSSSVYYSRDERVAGESKYPLKDGSTGVRRNNVSDNYPITYDRCRWGCHMPSIFTSCNLCLHWEAPGKYRCGLDIGNDCDFLPWRCPDAFFGDNWRIRWENIYGIQNRPKYFIEEVAKHEMRGEQWTLRTNGWRLTLKIIAMFYLAAIFLVYSPTIIFSYAFSDDWSTLSDVFQERLSVSMGYAIRQTLVCRCQTTCLYASSQYRWPCLS